MTVVHCTSCGREIEAGSISHGITGHRANGMGGGRMPSGRFDWCVACGSTAFALLADHRHLIADAPTMTPLPLDAHRRFTIRAGAAPPPT